ncbi:MAG: hypothetical protein K1X64_00145 [Myxococcaceae bacterium]|nr:hypothetical protein [Myxococcaceae bacterium]
MLSLVLITALSAAPAKQLSLALPGLTVVRLNKGEGALYSELLAQGLTKANVRVITSRDIGAMLGWDRQKQLMACNETSCAAELVGAMGADGLIVGDIGKLGDEFALNVKILSSKDGSILAIHNARAPNQKALTREVERAPAALVEQLKSKLAPPPVAPTPAPPEAVAPLVTPAVPPPLINEPEPKHSAIRPWSYVAMGVGVAGVATGVVLKLQSDKELEALRKATSAEEATAHARNGQRFETFGYTAIGVGSGLAIGGVIMFFLGDSAPSAKVSIAPGRFQLGFSGALP